MPKSGMKNGNVTLGHLGNLASTGQREESASHHVLITFTLEHEIIVRQHSENASGVVIWGAETSSRDQIS